MGVPVTIFNMAVYSKADAAKLRVKCDLLHDKMDAYGAPIAPPEVAQVKQIANTMAKIEEELAKLVVALSTKV